MAEVKAQDPTVYAYDEVYDSIEGVRKCAMAAMLGMGKNKPEQGEVFDDMETFLTSSYCKD